ncbi:hypothetical protein JCM18899A_38390 [Nocardioides sp. AN3]
MPFRLRLSEPAATAQPRYSCLIGAARNGEAFDIETGMPVRHAARQLRRLWVELPLGFIEAKWPDAS